MDVKRFLFLLFFAFSLNAAEICFFIPPKDWKIADPKMLAPRVHICFLGNTSKGLAPSINLATEAVDISLDSYIEEVRKIHTADPNSCWRDLGKYKTLLGDGRLTELKTPTELGMARLIQLVVIKDHVAYILTAGAIKEEFSKYYKTFDQVFRSLQSSSNLIESYPQKANQLMLKKLVENLNQKFQAASQDNKEVDAVFNSEGFQKEFWKPFEKKIINDFTEMGPYWQILLLKEVQTKILTGRSE